MNAQSGSSNPRYPGFWKAACVLVLFLTMRAATAAAADQIYFPQTTNVTDILVQKINAETVRIDMSAWYLGEHALSIALVNRFRAGVRVRLLGDRGSIFETDPNTRSEFYWLASQGVPIRLRYNPNWFPEIDHWKAIIFAGQKLNGTPGSGTVEFGSANFTPFELAPASPTNYKDETILFTDDPELVGAFKTNFDVMWNDTTVEPNSRIVNPPFFKNWDDACQLEPVCADYDTRYPPQTRTPMVIDTRRLEPDNPMPPDLIWGQGQLFNNRLIAEINRETIGVDLVAYRLTVEAVADAMINKFMSGVPVRFIVEPEQYQNRLWPEYWLTHAFTDKLWAAGIPIKQRLHTGLTHMKLLVTSLYATNASSNIAANWQRDHDYFVPKATKPAIYQAMKDHFQAMWTDTVAFQTFTPLPPDGATIVTPASGATLSTTPTFVWNRAAYAVSYDVYMGPSQSNMSVVDNVPAQLVQDPPLTYSWTPPSPLSGGTTYYWKLVSRTFATDIDQSIKTDSEIRVFTTTAGGPTPPGAPATPNPGDGVTGVPTTPTLSWTSTGATSYDVRFGTANPPPQVTSGQTSASYAPSTLGYDTTYFWQIIARNSGGTTPGAVWSFRTALPPTPPGAPATPNPGNGITGVPTTPTLSWTSTGATSYNVAFGTANPPPQVSTNQAAASYTPSTLATSTLYFWRVVANNSAGSTTGPVWSFTTAPPPTLPPGAPGSPAPANAATGVSSTPTLTWTASGATSYDVRFGTANPPPQVTTNQSSSSYPPGTLAGNTTYFWQITARNSAGTTSGAVWTFTTVPLVAGDIVMTPTMMPPGSLHGGWSPVSDPTAADGIKLVTPDDGIAYPDSPLASPVHYFDVAFDANAGTAYRIWLRTQALNDNKFNDAVWVQFSDAMSGGSPIYQINSASGLLVNLATDSSATSLNKWGWQNGAYWLSQPTLLTFASNGSHTLRVQVREDGVQLDQIVLSPTTYLNAAPGPPTNDSTVVPPPVPPTAPATPDSPAPSNGAAEVGGSPTLMWSASGATSFDVRFGTANPPPAVSAAQNAASYNPDSIAAGTTYFWQIVARNGVGSTTGPVWSFTTATPAPPPGVPASPSPASGATSVSTASTLTWTSAAATSYDVRFGTVNPPPQATTGEASASYTPGTLANCTTYFWQIVARNSAGTTSGPVWSFTTIAPPPPPSTDIVIYGNDVPTAAVHGSWTKISDATAAGGIKLTIPDNGLQNLDAPLASPVHYFDVSFTASAGTAYRIWLRLRSLNDNKYNDAVWVQFSDALANGSPIYGIDTTSALLVNLATDSTAVSLNKWGWQNGAYWLSQPTSLTFPTSGTHTMRVQIREDGVQLDQIVLSPTTYLNSAPGPFTNDTTIVPKGPDR